MVELEVKQWNRSIQTPKGKVGFKGFDPHSCLICFVALLPGAENNPKEAVDYFFNLNEYHWYTLTAMNWELQLSEFSRPYDAFVPWKPRYRVFVNGKQVLHGLTDGRTRVPCAIRLYNLHKGRNVFTIVPAADLKSGSIPEPPDVLTLSISKRLSPSDLITNYWEKLPSCVYKPPHEEGDDVVLLDLTDRLSARDPVTCQPIKYPVKGQHCAHLQPFDLEQFLLVSRQGGFAWLCPICGKNCEWDDLVADRKAEQLLQSISGNVVLHVDLVKWHAEKDPRDALLEVTTAPVEYIDVDALPDEPPPVFVKQEDEAEGVGPQLLPFLDTYEQQKQEEEAKEDAAPYGPAVPNGASAEVPIASVSDAAPSLDREASASGSSTNNMTCGNDAAEPSNFGGDVPPSHAAVLPSSSDSSSTSHMANSSLANSISNLSIAAGVQGKADTSKGTARAPIDLTNGKVNNGTSKAAPKVIDLSKSSSDKKTSPRVIDLSRGSTPNGIRKRGVEVIDLCGPESKTFRQKQAVPVESSNRRSVVLLRPRDSEEQNSTKRKCIRVSPPSSPQLPAFLALGNSGLNSALPIGGILPEPTPPLLFSQPESLETHINVAPLQQLLPLTTVAQPAASKIVDSLDGPTGAGGSRHRVVRRLSPPPPSQPPVTLAWQIIQ